MKRLLILLAFACGARTELGGITGSHDAATSCTAPPWVLFDYEDGTTFGLSAMHLDGSSLHRLDLGGKSGFHSALSPDEKTLLFVSSAGDTTDTLERFDLATKQSHTVAHGAINTSGDGGIGKGTISPDNTLIAYEKVPDLRLMAFDGSSDHVLVQGPYEAGCCGWSYGYATFSPDSKTIYFSTAGRLESIGVDGTGRKLLEQDQFFSNINVEPMVFPNPSLSPDATKLVAQVGCDVSELRIYPLASLPGDACTAGTKLVQVHTSLATNEASNATWGAAGIVYDDAKDLFFIDPSGGTPENITSAITTGMASASDPIWASGCADIP